MQVRSRLGVVLATGGFSRHPELRRRLLPEPLCEHSPLVESVTGDGVMLGQQAGGHLGTDHANNSFWAPVSIRTRADGSTAVFPHFVLDRGKPGLIAVNGEGRRFVNEATTYQRFAEAIYAAHAHTPTIPCHFICDDRFIVRYGLGMVRPRRLNLRRAIADGYVVRADTLAGLARALAIDPAALEDTVARYNGFAAGGIDAEFGKGGDAYQRNLGDPAHGPNPCIGPIRHTAVLRDRGLARRHRRELRPRHGRKRPGAARRRHAGRRALCRRQRHGFIDGRRLSGTGRHARAGDDVRLSRGPPRGCASACVGAAQPTLTSSQKPNRPPTLAIEGCGASYDQAARSWRAPSITTS